VGYQSRVLTETELAPGFSRIGPYEMVQAPQPRSRLWLTVETDGDAWVAVVEADTLEGSGLVLQGTSGEEVFIYERSQALPIAFLTDSPDLLNDSIRLDRLVRQQLLKVEPGRVKTVYPKCRSASAASKRPPCGYPFHLANLLPRLESDGERISHRPSTGGLLPDRLGRARRQSRSCPQVLSVFRQDGGGDHSSRVVVAGVLGLPSSWKSDRPRESTGSADSFPVHRDDGVWRRTTLGLSKFWRAGRKLSEDRLPKVFCPPSPAVIEGSNSLKRLLLRLGCKPGMECAFTGVRLRHEAEEE
jgi:hypothetical protein